MTTPRKRRVKMWGVFSPEHIQIGWGETKADAIHSWIQPEYWKINEDAGYYAARMEVTWNLPSKPARRKRQK